MEIKKIQIIWIVLLIEVLLLSIFKPTINDYEFVGNIIVLTHIVISSVILIAIDNKYRLILLLALILRSVFMYWDLYAQHIFILPNSGADSEFYFNWAKLVSEDLAYLTQSIHGGIYSKILGLIFYLTGPMRILAQYLNVLLGFMVVVVIGSILTELKINSKTTRTILLIAAFFPNSLIMSAILLREIIPTFLVALSLLYFIRWYNKQKMIYFILAIIFIGLAGMFHSGVVGLAVGFIVMILFYSSVSKRFEFNFRNLLMFIPVFAFLFLFSTQFGDMIFYKFRSLEEPADLIDSMKLAAAGGSAYLQGMTANNPLQFVLYAPIRSFYFLFSPLPMNWRGGQDITLFFIDSVFYGYVIYYFVSNRKWFLRNKQLITALFISVLVASLIYGIGVSNAGTAMRHRQKLTPVFLVVLAVMMNEKYRVKRVIEQIRVNKLKKNISSYE